MLGARTGAREADAAGEKTPGPTLPATEPGTRAPPPSVARVTERHACTDTRQPEAGEVTLHPRLTDEETGSTHSGRRGRPRGERHSSRVQLRVRCDDAFVRRYFGETRFSEIRMEIPTGNMTTCCTFSLRWQPGMLVHTVHLLNSCTVP